MSRLNPTTHEESPPTTPLDSDPTSLTSIPPLAHSLVSSRDKYELERPYDTSFNFRGCPTELTYDLERIRGQIRPIKAMSSKHTTLFAATTLGINWLARHPDVKRLRKLKTYFLRSKHLLPIEEERLIMNMFSATPLTVTSTGGVERVSYPVTNELSARVEEMTDELGVDKTTVLMLGLMAVAGSQEEVREERRELWAGSVLGWVKVLGAKANVIGRCLGVEVGADAEDETEVLN